MNAPTAAVLVSVLAVALAAVGGGDAQHAGEPELGVAPNPAPYHLAGGVWQIPDPFTWVPEYAFAQTQDVTPPTFVSSELNLYKGVLSITFSETVDVTPAANVDAAKIHIRESGTYTGGVTLTAGELDTAADGNVISFTLTASHPMTVTGLTAPELTIEPGAVQDGAGNLIIGTFDVSTASFVDVFSVASLEAYPTGVAFSSNGTKMFVVDSGEKDVNEYTLSTPFDVSTASFVDDFSVALQETSPQGVAFSSNGTKMFVVGVVGRDVNEYTLPTPFDVSTASYAGDAERFSVASQETSPTGVAFSSNGTKMFVVGNIGDDVNEYTLSTPFDVSTASFVDDFSVALQETTLRGVAFSSNGTKMFVVGNDGRDVNEYTLPTPFDVSTASYAGDAERFSVASQETSPSGVAFSSDGAKMFVVGSNGDDVNEYTLSSVYPITVIDPFVTTWNIPSDNFELTIPVHFGSDYNYTVIWGDGSNSTHTGAAVHTYADAGDHKVRIYGTFPGIHLDGHADASKLVSIDQWGSNPWATMEGAFADATNMVYNATDIPDLSRVTNMYSMFYNARAFNGNISGWDVSGVTNMGAMFDSASAFNGNISGWDVSGVTDMEYMFDSASAFNGNISGWNVSKVTNMGYMFADAVAFNGDISGWDVSKVTDMNTMFFGSNFNQPLNDWNILGVTDMSQMFAGAMAFNGNISGWDVSSVTTMSRMFLHADAFNGNISGWNVSGVTDMRHMFRDADAFNGDISGWNVSKVTNMNTMFADTVAFNGDISGWDVSGVTNMYEMFANATAFNGNISGWNVSKVTDMNNMFADAVAFNGNISGWNVSKVTNMNFMFANATAFNGDISGWNVSGVTDMSNMFNGAGSFNQPLNDWEVSGVTDMSWMFEDADAFNQNISGWNVSGVTDMRHMFRNADSFNGDISGWSVSKVTDMNNMFADTVAFNGDISGWNVSGVTDMSGMFNSANAFNQTISGWNVSGVTDMRHMFRNADSFNGDISGWNVSGVTDMSNMFNGAGSFNQPLNDWEVSGVTDMSWMFEDADAFNQNISGWNVSAVTDMSNMFNGAGSFNQPLNDWEVSGVTDMSYMFFSADAFNQNISGWNVSEVTDMTSMFHKAGSFNQPLNGWNVSGVTDMGSMFHEANSFQQNLGKWYVNLDSTEISSAPGIVGGISAQNQELRDQYPKYGIGAGFDESAFEITMDDEDESSLNMTVSPNKRLYRVNVTSESDFGTNNHRVYNVTVTSNFPPTVSAGDDLTVAEGGTLALSGSATDTDGDAITLYSWSAPPGSGITFADSSLPATTFTAPPVNADVTHTFTLTANDGTDNGTGTIEVTVKETSGAFITTWRTDTAGESIAIPVGGAAGAYDVIWGDGTASIGVTGDQTHTYVVSGDHTVAILGGFERIYLNGHTNATKLASIDQWGSNQWTSMESAFEGASAMTYGATDAPDLSGVTDMSFMFAGASSFNGNISGWDVLGVTDMSDMFTSASSFNGNISGWDVSGVTDMSNMFEDADSFNRPLNGWNVSGVTDMSGMFFGTDIFNQNISGWKVSGVTDMSHMFYEAAFNGDISGWNVSGVTDMSSMFYDAYLFNQPLNDWEVSGVTDMSYMFFSADVFNQNISGWNVSEVTDMAGMFRDAGSFNQPLNDWNVSGVTDMGSMFHGANSFQQNLGKWYVNLNSTEISSAPGIVGGISAQNQELRNQYPKYGIGAGFDELAFEITVDDEDESSLNMTVSPNKRLYRVNVTSENGFGTNNHRILEVTVTGTFDSAAPGPTLSTDTTSPTNSASATITVDFGEPIDATTFTLDDISITGGDASGLAQEGSTTQKYTFTITPDADGEVTASIPADRVTDPASNSNTASNVLSVTFDSTAPSPTLSTDATSPTNAASVTVTVDFGKPIDPTTFTLGDISATGGTASNLAHSSANQNFTFTITPSADGEVTASIPADRVTDPASNSNTASNVLSVTFDSTAPSPTLSTDATSPTNAASVTVTVDFGKPIDPTTFTLGDISATGGTASNLAHSSANQNFTFTITPSADGEVTASIPADRVTDPASNSNTASNVLRVTFDSTAPSPTLSTDATSPTNAASVTVTVDFGKPIDPTTFTLGDISATGGTASNLAHSSANQNFTFTITPDADGEVTASIPADRVTDPADNANTASNVLRVTSDSTAPSPTLSTDATSPTNAASVTVTVDFGKPIDPTTFTLGDISATGGTASNLAHSSANQNFTFTITPDADGEVTASIPADRVTDPADNANTASNVLSVTFDRTAPGPTLSTDADSPTNAASVTVTVDFGKPIDPTTFTLGDISATGGTASNLAHSSANQNFTFAITPDADGEVTASIPADRVTDPADNANTASNVLPITFDRTAPGPTLSTDTTSPTNSASATITVDFGEPIDATTFTLDDISVTGGDASGLAQEGSTTQKYTFTITPDADGEVTASIPADRVADIVGNANTASNILSVVFDRTSPGTTDPTPGSRPNVQCLGYVPYPNNSPVVDVGEDITIAEGETGTLRATVTDMDGDDVETFWVHWKPGTAIITIADPESLVTEFTAPYVDGDTDTYVILHACDGIHTGVGNDVVRITVTDIPEPPEPATPPQLPPPVQEPPVYNEEPSVDAGADFTINEGATGQLSGTATDPDNDQLTMEWYQTPTWPLLTLTDASDPRTTIVAPQVDGDTTITLILSVSDGDYIVPDQVRITIIDTG